MNSDTEKWLQWQTTPVFLPGEPYGQRSLAGYCPRGRESRTRFSDSTTTTTTRAGWTKMGKGDQRYKLPVVNKCHWYKI